MNWKLTGLVIGMFWASGCVQHVRPYTPKKRVYSLPVWQSGADDSKVAGSLWSDSGPAAYWSSDLRAARPNDVITIRIDEFSSATGGASTKLSRESEARAQLSALLGLAEELRGSEGGGALVDAVTTNTFDGNGKTSRSGRVIATVPAMVRQVLPNNHLFVEGHRVLLVNQEEHHFYISGVVRGEDIDTDNSVLSSRLADAQIEITGRGVVSEKNGPGWLARTMDWLWPF